MTGRPLHNLEVHDISNPCINVILMLMMPENIHLCNMNSGHIKLVTLGRSRVSFGLDLKARSMTTHAHGANHDRVIT